MSFHEWMDEQTMVHPLNRVLGNNKKKHTTDAYYNWDEFQGN